MEEIRSFISNANIIELLLRGVTSRVFAAALKKL